MAGSTGNEEGLRGNRWRIAGWGFAGLILLLPLIAMQVTDEVSWSISDFGVAGALVVGVGVAFELAVGTTRNVSYRLAAGVALVAAFLLVWLSLGVGIIGRDGDPANLLYFGVLGVGIVGALAARFRARGMARTLIATALAQASVGMYAAVAGLGRPWSGPLELIGLSGFFVAMFAASAWLFRRSADDVRGQRPFGS